MLPSTKFALNDPQTSARGAKTCTLLDLEGQRVFFNLGSKASPVSTPFGATSYNDEATSRKTLDLRLPADVDDDFLGFDVWAVQYLAENSERLFKKTMSKTQIEEHYRSPVSRKEGYQPLLRCKVSTGGKYAVRTWDEDNERTDLPEDLRPHDLVPRLHLSHLWIMGREFGWVFAVTDLLVMKGDTQAECPF